MGCLEPGRRTESLPALFSLAARDGEARASAPPFPPLPAAPAAPRPLAPAPSLWRGRQAQPAAARRGPRAPPPFLALPSPSSPPDTMTGPEQRISRVSLAAAAPAPGEAAGGGSCGARSREPGLTERAGGQDGRTEGRQAGGPGTAVSVDRSEDARRAAAGTTSGPGPGMRRAPAAQPARESGCAAHVPSRSLGREEEEEEGGRPGRRGAEWSCSQGRRRAEFPGPAR